MNYPEDADRISAGGEGSVRPLLVFEEDCDGLRQTLLGYGPDQGDGGEKASPHFHARNASAHAQRNDGRVKDTSNSKKE